RFHAITKAMEAWLRELPVERVIAVITSANHSGTRRNPLPADARKKLLSTALAGKQLDLVAIDDIADTDQWVEHVLTQVERAGHARPSPADTRVYSSNREV